MTDDRRQRGLDRMQEVYGFPWQEAPGDFFAITADHLFADIWNRPGLTVEQRRLMLIGLMVGRADHDVLRIQLDAALRLGELDADQLREIVIFLAHYAGWPAAARLTFLVEDVIEQSQPGSDG